MTQEHCQCYAELLPWYLTGKLTEDQQNLLEQHLVTCPTCREEVQEWRQIAATVRQESHVPVVQPFTSSWSLLQQRLPEQPVVRNVRLSWLEAHWEAGYDFVLLQTRLLHLEFWLVQSLAVVLAIILWCIPMDWSQRMSIMAWGSALLAVLGVGTAQSDEGNFDHELLPTTVTAPYSVMFSRMGMLAGIQTLLNGGIALGLSLVYRGFTWGEFSTQWLAPLCLLVALTLLFSVVLRRWVALMVAVAIWLLRVLANLEQWRDLALWHNYEQFWRQGSPLFLIALCLICCAFFYTELQKRRA